MAHYSHSHKSCSPCTYARSYCKFYFWLFKRTCVPNYGKKPFESLTETVPKLSQNLSLLVGAWTWIFTDPWNRYPHPQSLEKTANNVFPYCHSSVGLLFFILNKILCHWLNFLMLMLIENRSYCSRMIRNPEVRFSRSPTHTHAHTHSLYQFFGQQFLCVSLCVFNSHRSPFHTKPKKFEQ